MTPTDKQAAVEAAWHQARNAWMAASRHGTQEAADKAAIDVLIALLAEPRPEGEWVMVPREPTAAMCMAANDAFPVSGETTCSEIGRTIYRAMIEAAERQEAAE